MIIESNKVVSLSYVLRKAGSENNEIVETVVAEQPLTFVFGRGNLLPKFESNIDGLKVGDKFSFELPSNDAYGPVIAEAVVDLPISIFQVDGAVEEGLLVAENVIPMMDSNGNRLMGKVISADAEIVKMDFNHPMAGIDLHFTGEVVDIREATEEEIAHGHIHQASSCGGCGGGSCGDGCGEDANAGGCGCGGCN
jgi:FKBP-type peptidyl-prolyl cis-trans isomerase SlyD